MQQQHQNYEENPSKAPITSMVLQPKKVLYMLILMRVFQIWQDVAKGSKGIIIHEYPLIAPFMWIIMDLAAKESQDSILKFSLGSPLSFAVFGTL